MRPVFQPRHLLCLLVSAMGAFSSVSDVRAQSTSPITDTPPAPQSTTLQSILQPGSQGREVSQLQALLSLLGYYQSEISGIYNAATIAAVAQFQEASGLAPDGIMGPETWGKLLPAIGDISSSAVIPSPPILATPPETSEEPIAEETTESEPASAPEDTAESQTPEISEPIAGLPELRFNSRGAAVEQLQTRLVELDYLDGPIDGIFGNSTFEAVRAFQEAMGLLSDGIVGPATWEALLR